MTNINTPTHHVLQTFLWPEPGISTEHLLYMRLHGPAAYSYNTQAITFATGGTAKFDTAANHFNLGKWRRYCGLEQVALRLEGQGRFELVVFHVLHNRSWERPVNDVIQLEPGVPFRLDLTPALDNQTEGLLFFTLRALGEGRLDQAAWETCQAPRRQPQLVLSITTFKREAAVKASVDRFEAFMARSSLAPHLHLIVVDNGRSADIAPSQHVTPIANENLGGSGGFARGLLEAEARGATHCLFMDDDASVHMGAVERTWAFLAYAIDPRTAIAGALASAQHRWMIWENGAVFDRSCHLQWLGTDLRDFQQVANMEMESTADKPHNFYGGWWYFAFPIAGARYRPFPFFVRGDDISFSIANDFNIVTLPGVICFQDQDFADKESAQTLYLDLRNHIVHHLALPQMDIGLFRTLTIPARFFIRSLLQCHYESLSALNLAVEDVLRGPAFFAENADMAERRARIAAFRKNEAWKPIEGPLPQPSIRFNPHKLLPRQLMKFTLNGYILPFFQLYGNRLVLESGQRGRIRETWGAAEITYVSADGSQYFTVRHSKRAALREGWRMLRNGIRLMREYPRLKLEWREGYEKLASTEFWLRRLGMARSPVSENGQVAAE